MSYRGTQPPDDELQHKHEERNRVLRETMSIAEAAQTYGVSWEGLSRRLKSVSGQQLGTGAVRYALEDIEEAVNAMRRRRR